MTLDLQEVARAMHAAGNPPPLPVTGWSVDTRTQNPGDLYFALRGPNHDGHDFVASRPPGARPGWWWSGRTGAPNELVVSDTLEALQELAAWARAKWGGTVVGVTGSAGKTTTKDAIAHLLAVELPVGKTAGNLNNHVGVPLSILSLPDGCRAAVLEIGMNHAGEIRCAGCHRQAGRGGGDQRGLRARRVFRLHRGCSGGQARVDRGVAARGRGGAECRRPARADIPGGAPRPHGDVRLIGTARTCGPRRRNSARMAPAFELWEWISRRDWLAGTRS